MIFTRKRLGFRTGRFVLEDEAFDKARAVGGYHRLVAVSYRDTDIAGFWKQTKQTPVIDLTLPLEDIRSAFSKTTRNEIGRTERTANLTFVPKDSRKRELYKLYCSFEYDRGALPIRYDEFSQAALFSAYHNDAPIVGITVCEAHPYLRVQAIFSERRAVNDERAKLVSNATRRLIWEICRFGKKKGFRSLDLASVNLDDPRKRGITDFKMSFGGVLRTEYTYTYTSSLYRMLESATRLRNGILKTARIFRRGGV